MNRSSGFRRIALPILSGGLLALAFATAAAQSVDPPPAKPDEPKLQIDLTNKPPVPVLERLDAFRQREDYSKVVHVRAMYADERRDAKCSDRKVIGMRLRSVQKSPTFFDERPEPQTGQWTEQIKIDSCGVTVEQTVFAVVNVKEGLLIIAGMPGQTIADLQLQTEVSIALGLLERQQAQKSKCRERPTTMTELTTPPLTGGSWEERWVYQSCGAVRKYKVAFSSDPTNRLRPRVRPE